MVDAVAVRFLRPGTDNDIYDWVTAIFGDPWGRHSYGEYLIPAEYADEIHILLYDVAGAGGFFSASNNRLRDPSSEHIGIRHSTERLMFYVDAPRLARHDGPSYAIRALAHELQHMIHYYQHQVKSEFRTFYESWIDEMASEMAEDFLAEKLMLAGPRGVPYDDPTAGSPGITSGNFPTYNYYNHLQVSTWEFDAPLYRYYDINYALGAYLARAYGGAPLFRDIVQSDHSGVSAIEAALLAQGHAVSFEDLLVNWGVANLLSDDPHAGHPSEYNTGMWNVSRIGGVTYRLGSVNLFNYRYYYGDGPNDYHDGPYFYSIPEFNDVLAAPHSNQYVNLGRNTGTVRLRFGGFVGRRVTVVVKE